MELQIRHLKQNFCFISKSSVHHYMVYRFLQVQLSYTFTKRSNYHTPLPKEVSFPHFPCYYLHLLDKKFQLLQQVRHKISKNCYKLISNWQNVTAIFQQVTYISPSTADSSPTDIEILCINLEIYFMLQDYGEQMSDSVKEN